MHHARHMWMVGCSMQFDAVCGPKVPRVCTRMRAIGARIGRFAMRAAHGGIARLVTGMHASILHGRLVQTHRNLGPKSGISM